MRHNNGKKWAQWLDNQLRWAARQWRRAVHDGDGWHDDKGQQCDRTHENFNGRHDDDKGQQGNRRHDDGNERAR